MASSVSLNCNSVHDWIMQVLLVCENDDWQTQASSVFIPVLVMVWHSPSAVWMKIQTHCLVHGSVGWRKLNLIPLPSPPTTQEWNGARQLAHVLSIADEQYSSVSPCFGQVFDFIACFRTAIVQHAVIFQYNTYCINSPSFSLYMNVLDPHPYWTLN